MSSVRSVAKGGSGRKIRASGRPTRTGKPTSPDLRILQGRGEKKDRAQVEAINQARRNIVIPKGQIPPPPDTLKRKEEITYWRKYAKLLTDNGVLTTMDTQVLARFCVFLHLSDTLTDKSREELLEDGEIAPTTMSHLSRVNDACRKLESDLGLSPIARQRMYLPAPDESPETSTWKQLARPKKGR